MASEEDTVVLGLDIIVAIACVHRLCITNTTATMPSIRDQGVTQTQVSNTSLRIVRILVKCRLRPTKRRRRRQNTENDDIAFYPMARLRLEVRLTLNTVQPPFFIYGFFRRLLLLFRSSATSCLYYSIQTTTAIPTQTVLPCCLIAM